MMTGIIQAWYVLCASSVQFMVFAIQVCGDIMSILRINGAERFSASINRPNLSYEVRRKPANAEVAVEDICSWISDNYPKGESGIIYCLTR